MKGIHCALQGHLGGEVQTRRSQSGKEWCRLSVGVGEGDEVTWASVAVFEEKARALVGLTKGAEVYVEGRLTMNTWEGKDGQQRTGLSVSAGRVEVLGQIGKRRRAKAPKHAEEFDDAPPALQGHASEGRNSQAGAVAKAEPTESKIKAARVRAKLAIHPSANAAMVIEQFGDHFGDLDLAALVGHLKDSLNDISKNDLRSCEAMLYSHAHALQAIFVSSALRAAADQEWGMNNYETHMRVALKAQSQCRATLETLATIKNPPVVFARQANIAAGHQQVNNAMMPAGEPRAGEGKTENAPNKLSEGSNGLPPDTGAPGAAVGSDPAMATLGTFDGAEVRRR